MNMSSTVLCGFTIQQLVDEQRLELHDVFELQHWIEENYPQLPQLTPEQVGIFLLAWSNDIEKTKHAIKLNYKLRKAHPELFNNRDMQCKEVQKAASVLQLSQFPGVTSEGYVVYFGRINDPIYSNLDMEPCLKLVGMSIEAGLREYPPNGAIVLLDMKGLGLMHLTRIKFSLLRPLFQYIQGALNFKLIRVHIINTVYFLDKLMAILSPFLSAELVNLLHFHPPGIDMEEFYQTCIPKHCLPEDYGGDLPSIQWFHETNMKKLSGLQKYFDEEQNQRCDITKALE